MSEIPVHRRQAYEPHSYDATTAVPSLLKRVSWGAIFAGGMTATAVILLFGLLGSAIGFTSINPATEADPLGGMGTGTVIWYVVSSLIALFVGGFVAARLAGFPARMTAILHGLTVWALATLLTAYIAASAIGGVINTATSAVGSIASTAASVAGSAASNVNVPSGEAQGAADRARSEAVQIAQSAGLDQSDVNAAEDVLANSAKDMIRSPGDLGADFNQMIDRMFTGPNAVLSDSEQSALTAEIANRLGVSEAEAQQIASRWQQEAGQTADTLKSQAASAAGSALDALALAAWAAFFASLAGLIAAMIGAAIGAPKEPWMEVHHDEHD